MKYQVTVTFRGNIVYDIDAKDEDDAISVAIDKFGKEHQDGVHLDWEASKVVEV